jgi:hypothetical protein
MVEMYEPKRSDRKVIPFTTPSGLQIGSCYQPKPCPVKASAIEHYAPKRPAVFWWVCWSLFAGLAVVLLAGRV